MPVRHGRMMVSPFTFYRGAAKIMATDLKDTPTAGLTVQLCGDAHLSNFGGFASPERRLLFDLNDFDETFPGPFEWDVKRMAASFMIAARNNGFGKSDARAATRASVAAYRQAMASFAQMRTMDIWYSHLGEEDILAVARSAVKDKKTDRAFKRAEKNLSKARTHDSLQALSKLAEYVDGQYRLVSQPPIVVPLRDVLQTFGVSPDGMDQLVHDLFRSYRATLQPDRRHLLEQFQIVEAARKVVGVGSVGTRAFILLLQGRDQSDPLFLQVKEATASVLEEHLPKGHHQQPGERVVNGQRMMQAASDIFLGWTKGVQAGRLLLRPPAAGHESLRARRGDGASRHDRLRGPVRVDTGAGPRPVGGPGRHRRVPRRDRRVRQGDHRLLRSLRRPERPRLPGVQQGSGVPAASRPPGV